MTKKEALNLKPGTWILTTWDDSPPVTLLVLKTPERRDFDVQCWDPKGVFDRPAFSQITKAVGRLKLP